MLCALMSTLLFALYIAQWTILIQAILSWLIVFNVINMSNDVLRSIWIALERLTEPLYRPIRRFMPDLGGLDISPLIVLLIIFFLSRTIGNYMPYCAI